MALKPKQKTSASLDLVRQTFARIGREEGLLMVARKRLAKGDIPAEV